MRKLSIFFNDGHAVNLSIPQTQRTGQSIYGQKKRR